MNQRREFLPIQELLKTTEQKKLFQRIRPHFPIPGYHIHGTGYKMSVHQRHGGTVITNLNFNAIEVTAALETITEMGCAGNCFFLTPFPTIGAWVKGQEEMVEITRNYMLAMAFKEPVEFMPYFALHSISTPEQPCAQSALQLLWAKINDNVDYIKEQHSMTANVAAFSAEVGLWNKLGVKEIKIHKGKE